MHNEDYSSAHCIHPCTLFLRCPLFADVYVNCMIVCSFVCVHSCSEHVAHYSQGEMRFTNNNILATLSAFCWVTRKTLEVLVRRIHLSSAYNRVEALADSGRLSKSFLDT